MDMGTWCGYGYRVSIRVHGVDMGTGCGYGYRVWI